MLEWQNFPDGSVLFENTQGSHFREGAIHLCQIGGLEIEKKSISAKQLGIPARHSCMAGVVMFQAQRQEACIKAYQERYYSGFVRREN